jgi:hypothetical protein
MTTNKKKALFILRLSFLFTTDNLHYVNYLCIWYTFKKWNVLPLGMIFYCVGGFKIEKKFFVFRIYIYSFISIV